MISLPPRDEAAGAEARVLLAECKGPAATGYTLAKAKSCMQLMDVVLWNRFSDPGPFGAKGAKTLADVIRAKGQFAGFESYPNYAISIKNRIQSMIDIANNSKDKRNVAYTDHITTAIAVANDASIPDPSAGTLASWRTAGSGSPGSNFKLHGSVLGNEFYYIE